MVIIIPLLFDNYCTSKCINECCIFLLAIKYVCIFTVFKTNFIFIAFFLRLFSLFYILLIFRTVSPCRTVGPKKKLPKSQRKIFYEEGCLCQPLHGYVVTFNLNCNIKCILNGLLLSIACVGYALLSSFRNTTCHFPNDFPIVSSESSIVHGRA
jgi:hypothetical protein